LNGLSGAGSRLSLEAVTVVERPEWGALTGTVTAGADGEPLTYTGNIPPFFIVLSGPCTTAAVDGHFCVGRWPGGYLPNEHCDIIVAGGGGGALGPCPVFDTSDGYDPLALPGGAEYGGARPCALAPRFPCASGLAGAPLAAGDALSWTSDDDVQGYGGNGLPRSSHGAGGGWQICFA
jgi:hypothetical protein